MYGDSIEFLVILIAKHTNLCIENTQAQVSKTYDTQGGKFTVRGMMDCTVDGNVFDVKSASTYAFKKFKDLQDSGNESQFINNDAFAYVDQLDVYSGILHADNAIHPQGWIAVEKQLGHIATPVIESEAAWDRHVPLVDAQMRAPLPPERNAGTDHHLPVADGKSGNMKLPISCSYCDYKRNCWQDANGGRGIRTFLYSNKPVDLVVVSREPKVKELL